jgi:hypothetical protein
VRDDTALINRGITAKSGTKVGQKYIKNRSNKAKHGQFFKKVRQNIGESTVILVQFGTRIRDGVISAKDRASRIAAASLLHAI